MTYYLALWDDLAPEGSLAMADILSAPAWLIAPPEGEVIGAERAARRPLVAEVKKKGRKPEVG